MGSDPDLAPPTLTLFDFNPKSIDVTTGSASLQCSLSVTDNLSGVDLVRCVVQSPSASKVFSCMANPGSPLSADVMCSLEVPQYSEEGAWTIHSVAVWDAVGNFREYLTPELVTLGFPTELTVGFLPGLPLTVISTPVDGKRVRGNSLTARAELVQGSSDDVSPTLGVRFDFRPLPSGVFGPIPARNVNHPNPDTTYPYFIHWDVSGVADGDYELRAVAHDLDGIPDPLPETVTITIAQTGVVDIDENFSEESVQESHSGVSNSGDSFVESADSIDVSTVTALVIPAGALTSSSDTAILSYSDFTGELSFAQEVEQIVSAVVDFTLESGQTDFESGLAGDLIISYSDYDQDGYVDGTGIAETGLELRRYDFVADAYVPIPGSTVMTEHNMVHANASSTGRYGIVPEPSCWMMLGAGAAFLGLLYRRRAGLSIFPRRPL